MTSIACRTAIQPPASGDKHRPRLREHAVPSASRQGRDHFWLALPVQSQICSWVPGVVDQFVSSRHLLDCGLYSDPLDCGMKTCAPVLLQVYRSTVVPSAVPPPLMSMHLPKACSVLPAWTTVHCWALVPLQVYTWTGVKFALLAPRTSTHRPP